MNEFISYTHVERYGNDEVTGIELGELTIFPKLDGTNASVWATSSSPEDWDYRCGSRTRELSIDADNAGFLAAARASEKSGLGRRLLDWVNQYPNFRLYGEWLVPHTLKTYRDDAWRRFWVFDVYNDATGEFLSYDTYQPCLERIGLDYIPPLAKVKNGDYEYFIHVLKQNVFFIKDGAGIGEGIVLKNYNYINKFGRIAFAKIINNEFKEAHHRTMGCPESERKMIEEEFALATVSEALCTKTWAKLSNDNDGWNSRLIPELLGRVYHDVITEELWNQIKKLGITSFNFKTAQSFVYKEVKRQLPHLF